MAKWLDKYEQGGMVLKQKTHDNYGKKPNPNDVQMSAGPGFVGEGYNIKGRDYSPAWGGQFAMGGSLPGSVGFMYARTQDPAPSNGPYAKKTLASAQNGKKVDPNEKKYQAPDKNKIVDWFNNYYTSPFFKENLYDKGNAYMENVGDKLGKATAEKINNLNYTFKDVDSLGYYKGSSYDLENTVNMGNPNNYYNQSKSDVLAHELGHVNQDAILGQQPRNLAIMLNYNNQVNRKRSANDIYNIANEMPAKNTYGELQNPYLPSVGSYRADRLKNWVNDENLRSTGEFHDHVLGEVRGDIMALRYLASKEGIWDAAKNKPGSFTPEMLDKLYKSKNLNTPQVKKDSQGNITTNKPNPKSLKSNDLKNVAPPKKPGMILNRLREKYNDSDLLYLMNKLAKNEENAPIDKAQNGKEMPKAYWASNDERDAYRKNLKAAAEAALTNNASDEDLLINTSYHNIDEGNNCISGVCGLNRKAGLTYNKPTDQDRFLSGEKFAQAVAKGDEDYYQVSGNFQPGDHLQYRHKEGSSSHNKIIYDIQVDDKGEKMYKVIDNAGGKDMRSRDYTEAELKELVEKGGGGYDKVNIYRPGYNLDKPLLDKEREAKTSPEARAALVERKNIQEWDASHNPGFDYSIRPESEYYNKQPEGMKKFIDFANDDAKVTALAKKLNVGKDIIHDQLLNTFGELGQENKWADRWFGGTGGVENTVEKLLTAVGGGKGWSVGPGQIKYKTLDPELKKQFDINRPKDLHDIDKVIPLMTAINVKNKKWMENQGDDLSTKLIGTPGVSADEIKYGVDRWVPYAYQGLPTDPVASVRRDAQENANSYRMSTKDREDYINNYIKKNIDPDKLKTFDEGSYAGRVYNLIDKNLSRTMPAQNYEQYNELMPVTVKSKKKMQNGGEMAFYQNGLDFKPKTISKNGSVIKDDMGQWAHPGEVTEISGNTMATHGYGDVPLYVVPDKGSPRIVQANTGTQKFPGATKFTEFPMAQDGGWLDKYK